ncbi:MAG: hypothetical protein K2X81_06855, partial [Candidatus Obscuribacterales bacterium]|nr:hypothetical protein [Candidatus Obscuribacterales bacterium]
EENELVKKPEQMDSEKDKVAPLNLLDLTANEMVGHHHGWYPNPYPQPPHGSPWSHAGGTQIEVHNGKVVVKRN